MTSRPILNGKEKVASAAVFLSASLWGLFWVPIRYFNENGISGEWAIVLLYLPAFLVLLVFVLYDLKTQRRHLKAAALIGVFIGVGLGCYGVGILYTSVVRATLLFYLTPVWSTLLGFFFLGEAIRLNRWGAIILGLLGLFFLLSNGDQLAWNIGDTLSLASGVCWAIGAAIIRRNGAAPVAGMSLFQFGFAVVFVLLIGSYISAIEVPTWASIDHLVLTMTVASICMVLPAIYVLFWSSQILSPGRVGLLMMSEALVAVASASFFLPEEDLMPVQWLGAALIMGASLVELASGPVKKRAGRTGTAL